MVIDFSIGRIQILHKLKFIDSIDMSIVCQLVLWNNKYITIINNKNDSQIPKVSLRCPKKTNINIPDVISAQR